MQFVLLVMTFIAISVSSANAANFWLSFSNNGSYPPDNAAEIPVLSHIGTMYLYGRPDAGKTLQNWNLNLHTSSPGEVILAAVNVPNPVLGQISFPLPVKPVQRYEFPADAVIADDGQSISMQAFTLTNMDAVGVGIGPETDGLGGDPFTDPLYFPSSNSWLLAEITYLPASDGLPYVYLQIGQSGLNHLGEDSAATNVIFGALTDPALNGTTGRLQDSLTPEVVIYNLTPICGWPPRFLNDQGICAPEPSTAFLGTLGLLALVVLRFRKSQASRS